jgi:hypothetical protein
MIAKSLAVSVVVAGILMAASISARAEDEADAAALAKALPQATVPLDQGLKASEREGKPISAKYEIEDGALQLSVYTMRGTKFSEVIVDHKSGAIKKAEPITEGGDLKEAQEESAAMAKAKLPLESAVTSAVKANSGYRAVSVTAKLEGGQAVAAVTLMRGTEVRKVTEKLN